MSVDHSPPRRHALAHVRSPCSRCSRSSRVAPVMHGATRRARAAHPARHACRTASRLSSSRITACRWPPSRSTPGTARSRSRRRTRGCRTCTSTCSSRRTRAYPGAGSVRRPRVGARRGVQRHDAGRAGELLPHRAVRQHEPAIALLAAALRTPLFLQDELERERASSSANTTATESDPFYALNDGDRARRSGARAWSRKNPLGERDVILHDDARADAHHPAASTTCRTTRRSSSRAT